MLVCRTDRETKPLNRCSVVPEFAIGEAARQITGVAAIGIFLPFSSELISLIPRIDFPVSIKREFDQKPRISWPLEAHSQPELIKKQKFPCYFPV
jgi:hypothetical protein